MKKMSLSAKCIRGLPLVLSILIFLMTSFANAADNPDRASPSNTTNTTWPGWTSAGGVAAAGGNITNATLNSQVQTWKWCGLYGNVFANVTLKDASGNTFYYWTMLNVSGAVIAIQNSSPSWDLVKAAPLTGAQLDALFFAGDTGAADNATQTFNSTSWGGTVAGVVITSGQASSGAKTFGGSWWTEAINITATSAGNTTVGFVGNINKGQTLFNGGTGDYQIIVPARNPALTTTVIYYFYVQLA